ncbi:MAG TPA: glycosyltransferase family 2 protein [Vicinamibacterales bacterium]|nr:glycosyltransferase family 2 protein [Vicinamibacterales bacterium]
MTITAIVCAYNEARHLPACLFSLLAQTRPPDELLIVNNASTDDTGAVARSIARGIPNVRVIDEPAKGLVVARETARRAARGSVLAYVDADCRAPLRWLERVEAQLLRAPSAVAITGPYKFYDWDPLGRALIAAYDVVVAPPTHVLVHHAFGIGAILYGGNFAVRATAIERIGGFDRRIEFHGEDTNLGRRLTAIGRVRMCPECWVWTSARRYQAMGKRKVFSLYVRNFWSEILRHRPADREHLDVRV